MIAAVKAKGPGGFTELSLLFKDLDENGSGDLSYGEFLNGCQRFNLRGMTNEKYRILFNDFDKSGDGLLTSDEFIRALRGDLSRKRMAILFTAFRKLDRNGVHNITIDKFLAGYNPSSHPDIARGAKTEDMVLTSIINAFNVKVNQSFMSYVNVFFFIYYYNIIIQRNEDLVSKTQFDDYFSNLSTYYDNDDDFVAMVCQAFNIDKNSKAPPPDFRLGKGAERDMTPMGKQVHGDYITWNQEPSSIESRDNSKVHKKKVN
jgi:hypothetical protein